MAAIRESLWQACRLGRSLGMAESIAGAGTREALESGRLSPSQYGRILSSIKEAGGEASRIAGLEAQAAGFDALVSLWYRGNHPAAMETLRAGIVGLQGALADGGLGKISPQLEAGFEMGVVFGRAEGAASIVRNRRTAPSAQRAESHDRGARRRGRR